MSRTRRAPRGRCGSASLSLACPSRALSPAHGISPRDGRRLVQARAAPRRLRPSVAAARTAGLAHHSRIALLLLEAGVVGLIVARLIVGHGDVARVVLAAR